jgi:hypothetical protein
MRGKKTIGAKSPYVVESLRGAEAPLFHIALRLSIVPEIEGYGEGVGHHMEDFLPTLLITNVLLSSTKGKRCLGRSSKRHLQDFGQVQGAAGRELGDLLAATKAIGNDEALFWGVADGGEEFEFADGF